MQSHALGSPRRKHLEIKAKVSLGVVVMTIGQTNDNGFLDEESLFGAATEKATGPTFILNTRINS